MALGGTDLSTGMKVARLAGIMMVCLGSLSSANAAAGQKKPNRKQPPPPLPYTGPTGPIQQVPLDWMAPLSPQVTYDRGQLTIVALNSTLGDILRAVRKQTGAEIDIPEAKERVVTHLGPGPARDVIAELLNGSRFNYVLLGSPADQSVLTRVVLVPRTSQEPAGIQMAGQQQAAMRQPGMIAQAPPEEMSTDTSDADAAAEENTEENTDQPAAEAEQPAASPDQPTIKTPQQLLQEMQQRQLQLQQQQQLPGQLPVPVVVPRPQQEPQQPQ
jgi:hypothetical protein